MNQQIVEEFHANGGEVKNMPPGVRFLLLHTLGAKSKQERITPLQYFKEGDTYIIVAAKGGAPTNLETISCERLRDASCLFRLGFLIVVRRLVSNRHLPFLAFVLYISSPDMWYEWLFSEASHCKVATLIPNALENVDIDSKCYNIQKKDKRSILHAEHN